MSLRHNSKFSFLLILCLLMAVMAFSSVAAQDVPTDIVPTEQPTEAAPTDAPPTEEAPVEIPTEVPPTEVPPPEVPPTVEVLSAAPTFGTDFSAPFNAIANQPLIFQVSVLDDEGEVRVGADAALSGGSVLVTTSAPAETSAPFTTVATIQYTAPETFAGSDSFGLRAIDADGQAVVQVVQINVTAALPTLEEAAPTAEPTEVIPAEPLVKEIIINYDPAASEAALQQFLADLGAEEVDRIPQIGAMLVRVPQRISEVGAATVTASGLASAAQIGFRSAEENSEVTAELVPNDPAYNSSQWGLKNSSAGAWVQLGWDHFTQRGSGVTVAVIDTGVDYQHPDLAGQLLAGYDFVNDDNNADDDDGHGTHVAGVIAARTNNALGIAGIAFNAKILPVKVLDETGNGSIFWTAQGIVYAVDRGAKIINMSLGGSSFSTTQQGAVNYALSRLVTVIASSGNTGTTVYQYPSSYDGVISVAAHDSAGNTAGFSTRNDKVWISAAGVGIYSLYPVEFGSYATLNGTSMAAPHVTGVAALLVSANVATTPAAVREALACGARDLNSGTLPGRDTQMGWGVLDADFALKWRYNSSDCKFPQPNDDFERATAILNTSANIIQPIHSRSATRQPSDPTDCISPDQTLWYTFRPTTSGTYHISTVGSSHDTVVAVYQGNQGALRLLACNDDGGVLNNTSIANPQLTAGQLYHIMVDVFGSGINDEVLQLQVKAAMETINTTYENTSANFAYSGTWASTTLTGSSGGNYHATTDDNATVSFSFVGDSLTLYRVVGPTMGDLDLWVNGAPYDFDFNAGNGTTPLPNRAAFTTGNSPVGISMPYNGLHTIIIKRRAGGAAGAIGLDRIITGNTTVGTVVTALTDDRILTALKYYGAWSPVGAAGAHLNTITRTTATNAELLFRAKGSAVSILRTTSPGYGTANVYVDGAFYGTMNNGDSSGLKVPYTISGLSPSDHVIRIVNNAGSTLDIDAVQPSSPAAIAAKTDERAATVLYTGNWLNEATPGAFTSTTRLTNDANARVDFTFTGNYLCIGYQQIGGGGSFSVIVDNATVATINTNGGSSFVPWCSHISAGVSAGRQMFFTGQHVARIVRSSAGVLKLDFVQPGTYNLITPARGVVQENDASLSYSNGWVSVTGAATGPNFALSNFTILPGAKSAGGFMPLGGSMRRTNLDNSSATFFINGTGFILYSSVGNGNGCMQVLVDGVVKPFQVGASTENGIFLWVDTPRYSPWAFGVSDLPRGIHKVELRADTNCSSMSFGPFAFNGFYVDIDAVRVFP